MRNANHGKEIKRCHVNWTKALVHRAIYSQGVYGGLACVPRSSFSKEHKDGNQLTQKREVKKKAGNIRESKKGEKKERKDISPTSLEKKKERHKAASRSKKFKSPVHDVIAKKSNGPTPVMRATILT